MAAGKRMSRRTLLKGAAAAVAAPYIVPASALGKAGWKPPSERFTVGFIGIGNMGSAHLGGFLGDKSLQIVAACDVDAVKRARARETIEKHYAEHLTGDTYRGCDEYNEFEKLLARPDIDAVLIATPDHWHALIAVAAARAGKDIYCEKPLSLTVREAWMMVDAVRRYGRVFQTGSQQRSEANFRYACELVRNGRIGQLQTVHVNIGMPSAEKYFPEEPVRPGLDWDRWLGPAPWAPYNSERCSGDYGGGWRWVRDYSGGMTTDWGAHHFDIGQWGMGMDGSGPVEIIPPGVDGAENLTIRYASGVTMYRASRAPGDHPVNGVLFTGTEGKVEVNRGYLRTWPEEIGRTPIGPGDLHLYRSPGHREDWVECMRSRKRPICDVEIGASTITVCHLANIASWLGRAIRWDPARREIIGDEQASRWLDRPKRAPWHL